MSLSAAWEAALDQLAASPKPFNKTCVRSVAAEWGAPDDVISGEGTRMSGWRLAPVGVRAVYASLDEETATREVTGRKKRMSGNAIISDDAYPRMTYRIAFDIERCVDLREVDPASVLAEVVAGVLDENDLRVSQDVGEYLTSKGIQGAIFPSVTGSGANVVAFLDAKPAPRVDIANRKKVEAGIEKFIQRYRKRP